MRDYKTVNERAESSFTEKKSRFISYIAPVTTEKEATDFIAEISAMHREAKHIVYAYSLLDGQIKRYSDAGEPQGTAGMPTLEVLLHKEIYNAAIATVRYFGGVLLGTGGLTRAYSKAASDAVSAAKIITRTYGSLIKVTIPYNLYGKVSPYLASVNCAVVESEFGENVTLTVFVAAAFIEEFEATLVDLTNGDAVLTKKEDLFFDI